MDIETRIYETKDSLTERERERDDSDYTWVAAGMDRLQHVIGRLSEMHVDRFKLQIVH